jgi:NMD protein affecting ribosome stability and mRNA decay
MPNGKICVYCGLAWYKGGRWIVTLRTPVCEHETRDGQS